SATLTVVERGTTLRTRRQMMREAIPSDPRDGSLTSMIAAPPARAARASASDRTLTSNLATRRFAAVRSGDLAEFGGLRLLDDFPAPGSREPRRSPLEYRPQAEEQARTEQFGHQRISMEWDRLVVAVDQSRPGHGIKLSLRPGSQVGRHEEY